MIRPHRNNKQITNNERWKMKTAQDHLVRANSRNILTFVRTSR
jgi:hypothetical protein